MSGSAVLKRYNHLLGEMEAVYHDLSLRLGMSDSVSRILYTLSLAGDRCPLHEICRQTGMSKQTVNSALRKLEQEGIVYLEAADGRAKTVCLTEQGSLFSQRTAKRIIQMEDQILSTWSEEDVQRYLLLTERFLEALREKAESMQQIGEKYEHTAI